MILVGATVGSSLAMTGADVMTRGAEETGAGVTTRGAEGPGTAGTGLKPEGMRRLLTEFGAWLKMEYYYS